MRLDVHLTRLLLPKVLVESLELCNLKLLESLCVQVVGRLLLRLGMYIHTHVHVDVQANKLILNCVFSRVNLVYNLFSFFLGGARCLLILDRWRIFFRLRRISVFLLAVITTFLLTLGALRFSVSLLLDLLGNVVDLHAYNF